MKMGSGGITGIAGCCNKLFFCDFVTDRNKNFIKMGINCSNTETVMDDYLITKSLVPAGKNNNTCRRGLDICSYTGGYVNTAMPVTASPFIKGTAFNSACGPDRRCVFC